MWPCRPVQADDRSISETPETRGESNTVTDRSNRLSRVAAWVGIVAGVMFVVAVIFFSGLFLGWTSGGHYGKHRGYCTSQKSPGMLSPGGMMSPGMMIPGQMSPGQMGPGGMGPGGMMSPGQQPSPTTTPAAPRP